MKKKLTAIIIATVLTASFAGCTGNNVAENTETESSAASSTSSAVAEKESSAVLSSKPAASTKPTATAKPTAKPNTRTESSKPSSTSSASKTESSSTVKPTAKPAATAKPSSSNTSNSKPSGSAARPTPAPTAKPTAAPTAAPTAKPTAAPTAAPTAVPTATPKPKEKVWVVDVPAQEEVGHWEDVYWMGSDWVYQCNGCKTIFSTEDEAADHNINECINGNLTCGSYTMIGGEPYKHYTGEKYWVVDTPAQDEVGHWEYR